jgi:SAM-dependent methyltransferase
MPFSDGAIDRFYAYALVEHLDDFDNLLKEVLRCLKPGGTFYFTVPHYSSCTAFCPFHKSYYRAKEFLDYRTNTAYDIITVKKFNLKKFKVRFFPKLKFFPLNHLERLINHKRIILFLEYSKLIYLLPINDIEIELEKKGYGQK